MTTLPPEPNPGERISASFVRKLMRYIRSITPIQGPGIKLSRGPNGTSFIAQKQSVKSSSVDKSCFRIEKRTVGEEELTFIVDCYVNVGGVTSRFEDTDVTDLIPEEYEYDEDPEDDEDQEEKYICLKIEEGKDFEIVELEKDELQEEQKNELVYIKPLYLFRGSKIVTDLRTAQHIQFVESLLGGGQDDEESEEESSE